MKILFLFLSLFFSASAEAATYYVSPASGSPAGSNATSCNSAQKPSTPKATVSNVLANCTLNSGDTILLYSGVYTDGWTFPANVSGVTIQNVSGNNPILRTAGGSCTAAGSNIWFQTSNNMTLRGFEIDGGSSTGGCGANGDTPAVHLGTGSGTTIENMKIHNAGYQAIAMDSGGINNLTIRGNEIYKSRGAGNGGCCNAVGIYLAIKNTALVENNYIHDFPDPAIDPNSWGTGFVIGGPQNSSGGTGLVVRSNRVENAGQGIWASRNITNSSIYNNLVYDNKVYGMSVNYINGSVNIFSNTIYRNGFNCTMPQCSGERYAGVKMHNLTGAITTRNNIVYGNNAGDIMLLDTCANCVQSNNLSSNPQFVSTTPGSSDFLKIGATSPAKDAGYTLGSPYNVDYAGTVRPQGTNYDIGAYEYGGSTTSITGTVSSPTVTIPSTPRNLQASTVAQ